MIGSARFLGPFDDACGGDRTDATSSGSLGIASPIIVSSEPHPTSLSLARNKEALRRLKEGV